MDASRQAFSVEDQMKSLPSMVPLVERVIWPLPGKIEDEAQIKLDPPRAFVIQGAEGTSIQVYSVPVIDEKIEVVGDQPVELLKQEEVEIKLEPRDLDQEDDECVLVKDEEKKCVIVEDEDEKKCGIVKDEDDQTCVIGEDEETQSFSSQVIKTEDEEIQLEVTEKEQADNVSVKSEAKDDQDYEIIEDDQYCEIIEDDQDCEIIEDEEHLQEENSKVESSDSEYTDYETLEEEADDSVKPEDSKIEYPDTQMAATENDEMFEERRCQYLNRLDHGDAFTVKTDLMENQHIHSRIKPKPGMSSTTQPHLNSHNITRSNEMSKICLEDNNSSRLSTSQKFARAHTIYNTWFCEDCGESFYHHSALVKHRNFHHTVNTFVRNVRHHSFATKASLLTHMSRNSPDTSTKRQRKESGPTSAVVCDICKMSFSKETNLKLHKKKIHFMCFLCGRAFPTDASRTAHVATHEEVKNTTCPLCGEYFYKKGNLKRHLSCAHS